MQGCHGACNVRARAVESDLTCESVPVFKRLCRRMVYVLCFFHGDVTRCNDGKEQFGFSYSGANDALTLLLYHFHGML